jgi:hypothetical protein
MVWDHATDKDTKKVYLGMEAVHRTDDLGGAIREGSAFHCAHSDFDIFYTIADWNPPHHFVASNLLDGIPIQFTLQLIATDGGTLTRMMYGQPGSEVADDLKALLEEGAQDSLLRLADILEEALAKAS